MKKEEAGRILKNTYSDPDPTAVFEDAPFEAILNELSGPLFTLSTFLNLPQCFRNRQNRQVIICGKVSEGTREYVSGLFCFSREEEFFTQQGQLSQDEESPGDLIFLDKQVDQQVSAYPIRTWIHPDHYDITSFFRKLRPNDLELTIDCHYINRMGFVSKIVQSNDDRIYVDENNRRYNKDGQFLTENNTSFNLPSMYDLVYVIKNWHVFSQADWSQQNIVKQEDIDSLIPELFDPTENGREKKLKEFFEGLIKMHTLSKDLGIAFGFHLNDPNGIG